MSFASINGFGNCCGASIAYGLMGSNGYNSLPDVKQVKEWVAKMKASRTYAVQGMMLFALNDGQELQFGKVFRDAGCDLLVGGAHNGRHDSKIYLYSIIFNKEKSEPNLFPSAESDY